MYFFLILCSIEQMLLQNACEVENLLLQPPKIYSSLNIKKNREKKVVHSYHGVIADNFFMGMLKLISIHRYRFFVVLYHVTFYFFELGSLLVIRGAHVLRIIILCVRLDFQFSQHDYAH